MRHSIHVDPQTLGAAAAKEAGDLIVATIAAQGSARVVLATGASQFATLAALVARTDIAWSNVEIFHLDEYIGLRDDHPASFRRYLRERVLDLLPVRPVFHGVGGDAADPVAECRRLSGLLAKRVVDVLLLGIGENGHLAFNDPPADVLTKEPYLIVGLDDACRRQQLGEGWFPDFATVPDRAISMSIASILTAKALVASVPDERKAVAVRGCLEEPVSATMPCTYLRQHPRCTLHLDRAAASRLTGKSVPAGGKA